VTWWCKRQLKRDSD